jgi:hypothetical protein
MSLGYEQAERCRNSSWPVAYAHAGLGRRRYAVSACLTPLGSFRGVLVTITVTRTRPEARRGCAVDQHDANPEASMYNTTITYPGGRIGAAEYWRTPVKAAELEALILPTNRDSLLLTVAARRSPSQACPTRWSRSQSRPIGGIAICLYVIGYVGCSGKRDERGVVAAKACGAALFQVRNSIGPLNTCPDGHLILALSSGPSVDCMM